MQGKPFEIFSVERPSGFVGFNPAVAGVLETQLTTVSVIKLLIALLVPPLH